ncbi:agmatinase [Ostreibacterium oceani]|uniref:Agmatinase n=1 Tax=Ostreibacterium oceani TaxID=2654998 RepID=A0A6N7F1R7_9GAMM|nr:agmatinase [Ostreibacterium oceani]MPV85806.1 agmatinase [Ostreibacterium oceani]
MSTTNTALSYPHFLGSEIAQATQEQALFHVLPVPYEESVSYGGGTAKGPSAILNASWQLEVFDGKSRPCDAHIHTLPAIDCSVPTEQVLNAIEEATAQIVRVGAVPAILGGEHTISSGVIRGLKKGGMTDFGVVQFDAHADLRHAYEDNLYSHASVMKRVVEMGVPLYQLGVRAFCEEEMQARKEFQVGYIDADVLVPKNINQFELPDDFPENVFISFDVDGFDPYVMPATGTPVAGGFGWYQALALINSIAAQRRIIGFDVVELAPIENLHAYDFIGAQLVYKIMGIIQRQRQPNN